MAARTNYGNNVSALGPYSAEGNIGDYVNALNNDAASCNAGAYVNAFGAYAAECNIGDYVEALGRSAAQANAGDYVAAIGYESGQNNDGSYCFFAGRDAGQDNTNDNVIAIGEGIKGTNLMARSCYLDGDLRLQDCNGKGGGTAIVFADGGSLVSSGDAISLEGAQLANAMIMPAGGIGMGIYTNTP